MCASGTWASYNPETFQRPPPWYNGDGRMDDFDDVHFSMSKTGTARRSIPEIWKKRETDTQPCVCSSKLNGDQKRPLARPYHNAATKIGIKCPKKGAPTHLSGRESLSITEGRVPPSPLGRGGGVSSFF